MDKPEFIPQLEEAGKALAREVTLDHFGSFVGR
jgi:hypothetical protein